MAAPLRIDHVTVVDPRDGSRRVDVSIRVRNGVVIAVSALGAEDPVGGEWAIDGEGRFVVPGYANMHTHVLQNERPELFLATMLAEGTTGMRQMAGSDKLLDARRQSRLEPTGYAPGLLAMPGALLMPFNAKSIADVERLIAEQRRQGADFIKIIDADREVFFAAVDAAHSNGMRIAGHLPPSVTAAEAAAAGMDCIEHLGTGGNVWFQTSSDGAALRTEADHAESGRIPGWLSGLPFADHLFSTDFVQQRVKKMLLNPALLDSAETVALLRRALDSFDEDAAQHLVDAFARHKTWHTPTLVRLRTQYRADDPAYADHPWLSLLSDEDRRDFHATRDRFLDLPADTRATYHDCYDMSVRLVGMMHTAGVPIMAGTDGPSASPGQDLASEFRELAAAGLRPLDVLRSATTVPAAYLNRTHDLGAVDVGFKANFLLLDADPLASADNLSQIAAVIRAGHFIARDEIRSLIDQLVG
ncbi:amidohydrolase family protein [Mycolicibacterium canariasense]|nr:amidohydrolase family protein [Mycolicibacterium canariasense]MCV7212885.1 amidohydrolase family protein [Mycolicibacterium canariasense]